MNCLKSSRQCFIGAIALAALLLSLGLAACGTPANAANNTASPNSGNTVQQTQQAQQTQRVRPSHSNSSSSSAGSRSTDQQVQSLLRQLDGAQSDVNTADSGASQDSGQP